MWNPSLILCNRILSHKINSTKLLKFKQIDPILQNCPKNFGAEIFVLENGKGPF